MKILKFNHLILNNEMRLIATNKDLADWIRNYNSESKSAIMVEDAADAAPVVAEWRTAIYEQCKREHRMLMNYVSAEMFSAAYQLVYFIQQPKLGQWFNPNTDGHRIQDIFDPEGITLPDADSASERHPTFVE